jgi:hypothetical protein
VQSLNSTFGGRRNLRINGLHESEIGATTFIGWAWNRRVFVGTSAAAKTIQSKPCPSMTGVSSGTPIGEGT